MNAKNFLKSGHLPTLIAAFLYFDVSFMVWVLLGPLAPFLGEQLHQQRGGHRPGTQLPLSSCARGPW